MSFLFVDRIVESIPGKIIRGFKHISPHEVYLTQDESGRLLFPHAFIGETLGQLAAWNVMQYNDFSYRPVAGVVSSVKWHANAYVDDTLELESVIDCIDEQAVQYHSTAKVNSQLVFTLESALGPLLPMADFIDQNLVRQQFATIHQPTSPGAAATPSKNPRPTMTFDRILEFKPGVSLSAEKKIMGTDPYFSDHFPNKPVLPLTVLMECKRHLLDYFLQPISTRYQVLEWRKIKMNTFVQPGDDLLCHIKLQRQDPGQLVLAFRSEVADKRVCVLEMVVAYE